MQSIHLHRGREALRIADEVIESNHLSGRVAGLFHIRRARALAELADRPRALDAMAQARTILAVGANSQDPAWTWWIDENEVTWHEAMIYTSLGRHDRAIDLFRAGIHDYPIKRRGYYNDLAHMLNALVAVRAWREAEPVIVELLPYVDEIGSTRTESLLRRVLERLAADDVPDSVDDVARTLSTTLSAVH